MRLKEELTDLQNGLTTLGIDADKYIIEKFTRYLEILCQYKNRLHLLSYGDYNRISKRHFLPSLMSLSYIDNCNNACDIGAGAGFPSVPLKILRPKIRFTLFESRKKKADFLEILISELGLSGIQLINDRAENYRAEKFDVILIKAAGKIKNLIKTIDYLIVPNGLAIFYKSHRVEDEIKYASREIKKRHFEVRVEKLYTPLENLPLALISLKKS